MDGKPSLFGSPYLGRNKKAQDNIRAKYYFSNITRLGKYLVDFDLRLDHRKSLEFDAFSSREQHCFYSLRSRGIKAKKRLIVWL